MYMEKRKKLNPYHILYRKIIDHKPKYKIYTYKLPEENIREYICDLVCAKVL